MLVESQAPLLFGPSLCFAVTALMQEACRMFDPTQPHLPASPGQPFTPGGPSGADPAGAIPIDLGQPNTGTTAPGYAAPGGYGQAAYPAYPQPVPVPLTAAGAIPAAVPMPVPVAIPLGQPLGQIRPAPAGLPAGAPAPMGTPIPLGTMAQPGSVSIRPVPAGRAPAPGRTGSTARGGRGGPAGTPGSGPIRRVEKKSSSMPMVLGLGGSLLFVGIIGLVIYAVSGDTPGRGDGRENRLPGLELFSVNNELQIRNQSGTGYFVRYVYINKTTKYELNRQIPPNSDFKMTAKNDGNIHFAWLQMSGDQFHAQPVDRPPPIEQKGVSGVEFFGISARSGQTPGPR